MRIVANTRASAPKITGILVHVMVVGGFAGCGTAGEGEPPSVAAAEPTVGVDTLRLDAAEAERLGREARADLAVELASGLELDLWAPEPLLTDPIALTVDNDGAVYVTGSSRSGMPLDIRGHPTWTTPALSFETVEDMRAFYRQELASERSADNAEWLEDLNGDGSHDWRDLTVATERVYRIRDTSGDGRADVSEVLVEGFNTEVSDVAGGIHVLEGDIYVAAAPDLWRLRDVSGDGVVDSMQVISHGYSVHPGFFGHGMSGVTLGPDGRIWWSVGDIGFTVVDSEGRRWPSPTKGAVLRAEPDGSGFEVFATGVRNTHEFVFDEYGNVISVDNDGDHEGETERVVYLVEGSDSGWRLNWQFGKYTDPDNNDYNVWMEEGLFRPRFPGQAAYVTPPIAPYHAGPSGMVYNPGTALNEEWRGHFLVASFTGTPVRSMVNAFRLEESGAGFTLARDTVLLSGLLATGLEFGPDGALYIADWMEGWSSNGTGRVWKLDDPAVAGSELRAETQALLAEAFDDRGEDELAVLLAHADMRVRVKAQLELAGRGAASTLEAAARGPSQPVQAGTGTAGAEPRLARLHGLWGIGQLARQETSRAEPLAAFLDDADGEVRAQAAKVIGDVRYAPAADALIPLLADAAPRVRFFAAEALGRIGHPPAVQPLIAMLEANGGADVYLRHAGALALARIGEPEPLVALAGHASRAVRLAAVVALRRMQDPGVARFLEDADEDVVSEAARAINDDGSIGAALPALAAVLERQQLDNEPLLRRAINANLRVGTEDAAQRVAGFAARELAPEAMRVEAIAALGVWARPSPLDRVDGVWHGPVEREASTAQAAVTPLIAPMFNGDDATEAIKIALAETVGRLAIDAAEPTLLARVQDDASPAVRVAALEALHALRAESIETAARTAIGDDDATVRMAAIGLIPELGLPDANAVELLASVLGRAPVREQQSAIEALGSIDGPDAVPVLASLLDQLDAGELTPELELELGEAVDSIAAPELQSRLDAHRSSAAQGGPVAAFRNAIHGGDAREGAGVLFRNDAAQCMRCHAIEDSGADVGPDLTRVGAMLTREQLLESLVDPSARIAPGFGTAPSAMPSMERILSRREIRDVVEFLSTLR